MSKALFLCLILFCSLLVGQAPVTSARAAQDTARAAKWKDTGVSAGATLPPAGNFQPRAHGEEAARAGLKPEVLARLDIELQRHVAAKNVAGIAALIHRNGARGYFETFGLADLEAGKPIPKDAIFRLMSMTKPVIALAALTLYEEGRFSLDEPIATHCPASFSVAMACAAPRPTTSAFAT